MIGQGNSARSQYSLIWGSTSSSTNCRVRVRYSELVGRELVAEVEVVGVQSVADADLQIVRHVVFSFWSISSVATRAEASSSAA